LINARKGRGPTFSERIRRSQSTRCWSVKRSPPALSVIASPAPDLSDDVAGSGSGTIHGRGRPLGRAGTNH
jgi:hypothetical protein